MTRIIQLIDNLDFARDGTETKADHTIRFVWQVDDGDTEKAELDLTSAHTLEFLATLRELAEHANPGNGDTGTVLQQIRAPEQPGSKASPVRSQGLAASRRYRGKQKKFADSYGIARLDGSGLPAYQTPTGAAYWPEWLDAAYQHYLATGMVIIPFSKAEFAKVSHGQSWKAYLFGWTPQREPRHVLESAAVSAEMTRGTLRELGGAGDAAT